MILMILVYSLTQKFEKTTAGKYAICRKILELEIWPIWQIYIYIASQSPIFKVCIKRANIHSYMPQLTIIHIISFI